MSFRYLEYPPPEDGGILDPQDWMLNMGALAGEFNGGLDADNLPQQAITTAMILQQSFTQVSTDSDDGSSPVSLDGSTTTWQAEDSAGNALHQLSVSPNTDALLIAIWSGTWAWSGSVDGSYSVSFRIVVDGAEVALFQRSVMARVQDAGFMVGALPVQAGPHVVGVEARQWEREAGKLLATETDLDINERELIVLVIKR